MTGYNLFDILSFPTKSKKFKNTVRTLLSNFRKSGDVIATKTKSGWVYSSMKKKDSASKIDEAESSENSEAWASGRSQLTYN